MESNINRSAMLDLDRFFFDIPAECPYGLPSTATYRQACLGPLPDEFMEHFWSTGFRRNGNTIYTMSCPDCNSCVPIRLVPEEFKPHRNQKRVVGKNKDVEVEIGALQVTDEKISLCSSFFKSRYPRKGNIPEEYYSGFFMNSITSTFEFRYKVQGKLLGVAIVDICRNSVNAVYFYFDPAESHRSPGTFNVMYLVAFCRIHKIQFLYLGYWVNTIKAMRYKANFKPHYLLSGNEWVRQK